MEAIKQELAKLNPEYRSGEKDMISMLEMKMNEKVPPKIIGMIRLQLDKLKSMPKTHPEYHVLRDYLELVVDLPWTETCKESLDIDRVEKVLDEDHYGLSVVKRRILQHLAVQKIKERAGEQDFDCPILLFHGPPGTLIPK